MNEIIMNMLVIGILFFLSIEDIKHKSLPMWSVIVLCVVCSMFRIIELISGECALVDIITGCLPGLVITILSLLLNIVGVGDGMVLFSLGLFGGLTVIIKVVILSFSICAVISLLLLFLRRVKRSDRLAFVPYIAMAFVGVRLCV